MAIESLAVPVWGYRVELEGQPIYFGIGNRRRSEHVHRGSHNRALRLLALKGADLRVVMIDQPFPTRADAQEWERDMIAFFGRRDLGMGKLFNFTDGGDGLSREDAQRLYRQGKCPLTLPATLQKREKTTQRQLADGTFVLQRKSVRENNKESVRNWHKEQAAAGTHPFQDRNTKQKIAALRKERGTHRMQGVPPWRHFNASPRTLEFWQRAPEAIELLRQKVPYLKIGSSMGMGPGHVPVQVLVRRVRAGWIPTQDIDWDEWARAFRAKPLTGEHSNGTNPTRSKELQPVH